MIEAEFSHGDGWGYKSALQSTTIDKSSDGRRTIESVNSALYWLGNDDVDTALPPLIRVNLSKECTIDSVNVTSNAKFIELYVNCRYVSTLKGYNSEEGKYLFTCSYDQRLPTVKMIELKFLSLKLNKELTMTAVSIDVSPKRVEDAVQITAAIPTDLKFNFKKFDAEIGSKLDNKVGNSATLLASMLQSSLSNRTDDKTPPLNLDATTTTKMNSIGNNHSTIIDKMIDMKLQPLVAQLNRIEQMQLEILKKLNV